MTITENVASECKLIHLIIRAIAQGELATSISMLYDFATESNEFPQRWLLDTARSLETKEWDLLSDSFVHHKFIGSNGYFLIIAPYTIRRENRKDTTLTAILGRVIPTIFPSLEIEKLEQTICGRIGSMNQSIPIVLPYERITAYGNANSEQGEAFIVPNNWEFSNSFKGPALNDMTEQEQRFLKSGKECIRRIWEPESGELLLAALEDEVMGTQNRHLEYQFHDIGHATGLGINRKIQENLFPTYWYGSVEEWRSDGVEFELAEALLSTEESAQVVAVNLCVRFGLDAHRNGGIDRDGDVCASLLTLDRLFESGEIDIKNGCLRLRNLSCKGLLQSIEPHRQEAVHLTQQELMLDYSTGLWRLYGSVKYNKITEKIFDWLVIERCEELYPTLR